MCEESKWEEGCFRDQNRERHGPGPSEMTRFPSGAVYAASLTAATADQTVEGANALGVIGRHLALFTLDVRIGGNGKSVETREAPDYSLRDPTQIVLNF